MEFVDEWNEHRRRHDYQEKVRKQEVGCPEGHLDDLDHELAGGLRERRRPKTPTVPLSGPPSPVRLFVLQLARQEHGDKDLLNGTLNGNDGDDTKHRMRRIPKLEEPLHHTSVST